MRLSALIAATATSAALFAVLGHTPAAHAEAVTQTPEQPAQQQKIEEKYVEVKPGDYLAKIADENQTTYVRLFNANEQVKDPDVIYPGDKLRVPRAEEQLKDRLAPMAAETQSTAPTPAPKPKKQVSTPTPPTPVVSSVGDDVWDQLARCEAGGNWHINTGNGYYGGLQFSLGSWRGVGGSGLPSDASREEQIARGKMLQARSGWGAWPACSRKLGLR